MSNKYNDIDAHLAEQRFCCCICPCCSSVRQYCTSVGKACIQCCTKLSGCIYLLVVTVWTWIDWVLEKSGFYTVCAYISKFCRTCCDTITKVLSKLADAWVFADCRKYVTRGCAHCRYPILFIERKDSLNCCILSLVLVAMMVLSIMGVLSLIYMSMCDNLDSYFLVDSPQNLNNLTNMTVINLTPFGSIEFTSDSSGGELQVSVENHGLEKSHQSMMTTAERLSEDMYYVQSRSLRSSSVMGYDSTCENAFQRFTADPGSHIPGKIMMESAKSSNIAVRSDKTYKEGLQGLSFNELNLKNMYGNVNLSYVSANSIRVTSLYDDAKNADTPPYLLNQKENGFIHLTNVVVKDLFIHSITGSVIIENLTIRDGGRVNITTNNGVIKMKNVGDGGDYYNIVSEGGNVVDIKINGRVFHGSYNAQAEEGVVFFSPTSNMHTVGPLCSSTESWKDLSKLREHVGSLHHHCKQGSLGYAYGDQKFNIYAKKGDINLVAENRDL